MNLKYLCKRVQRQAILLLQIVVGALRQLHRVSKHRTRELVLCVLSLGARSPLTVVFGIWCYRSASSSAEANKSETFET